MESLMPYLGRLSAHAERRHCAMCGKDLTLRVRLECNECSDCEVCLQCVAKGEETSEHSRTHSYKVVDKNHFKLLDEGDQWLAVEEELLLEAIEYYGLGNWNEIAQHVGDNRSCKEVEQHFNSVYLQPDGIISQYTAQHEGKALPGETSWEDLLKTNPVPPVNTLRPDQELAMNYSQYRDEFETEFSNEAEDLIAGVEFTSEDDSLEKSVKLAQVEIYMNKVEERNERKRIVHKNKLITGHHVYISSKKRHIQEEKDFRQQHKVISRLNPEQYDNYLHSFVRERTLKQKIRELSKYRKNGLTQLSEVKEFENAKKLRDQIKTDKTNSGKSHKSPMKGLSQPNSSDILRMRYNYELLSSIEKELCTDIGISSSQYNTAKLKYFLAYNREGSSERSRERGKELVANDLGIEQAIRLDEFFEKCGWLYK